MDYYKNKNNVEKYIHSSIGYDGKFLISNLEKHLEPGSSVLEIGMGEGKDLKLLSNLYQATGSDNSDIFVKRFNEVNNGIKALNLDAVTLKTNKKFDGVYSNKVLIHLNREDCKKSIERQYTILNPGGIVIHSFWYGDNVEEYGELVSVNYNESLLSDLFKNHWEVLEMDRYKEMEENDSIFIISKKL